MGFQFILSFALFIALTFKFAIPLSSVTTSNGIFVRSYAPSSATMMTSTSANPVIVILHGLLDSSESFIEWSTEVQREFEQG
jgi:uncharacterized membrane protein